MVFDFTLYLSKFKLVRLQTIYTLESCKCEENHKYFGTTPSTKCLKCFDVGTCLKILINNCAT